MLRLVLTFIIASFFISAGAQPPFADFDAYVEKNLKNLNIPGLSVAIVKDGKVVFVKGYGVRQYGKPEKVDGNTVFAIGSNTKAFTGTLISILDEEKKLSLNDKVTDHLHYFKLKDSLGSADARILDLLTHRLGFQTFDGDFVNWGSKYSAKELIEKLRFISPSYPFRSKYGYCNMGFVAAGEIIFRLTDLPWHGYLHQKILAPLGMTRTFTSNPEIEKIENIAMPHTYSDEGNGAPVVMPYRYIGAIDACGGILSSANDMAKWLLCNLDTGNHKISRKALQKTWKPYMNVSERLPFSYKTNVPSHLSAYGLGWFINDRYGKALIHHSGGVDGMLSKSGFMPELGLGVVVLTNYDDQGFFETLFYKIIDSYLGQKFIDDSEEEWKSMKAYTEKRHALWTEVRKNIVKTSVVKPTVLMLAGTYSNPHYGNAEITLEGNRIRIIMKGHAKLAGTLTKLNGNEYLCVWDDIMFRWSKTTIVDGSFTLSWPDYLDNLKYTFTKIK
jgi:CubicO group peptidase (beta-lactamase class C family)